MTFTKSLLVSRPYRYYLLLHDFMNRARFELAHSGQRVVFEYMGNSTKFFTPAQFTTYHDVHDAIVWMKSNDINFKHEKLVYALDTINMPHEYDHGSTSEFYHIFVGLAIILSLRTKKSVRKEDLMKEVSILSKRSIMVDAKHTINLDVNVNPSTLNIVKSPMFMPLLKNEIKYAIDYVNQPNVKANIDRLIGMDKYDIKVIIGQNRGITTDDIKLFENVKGNFKEIKLGNRIGTT